MTSFDALKKLLILRLYEQASAPAADGEFSEPQITGLLVNQTGLGIANQVFGELLNEGLLRQTAADSELGGAYFEVTATLIRLAEQTRHSESPDKGPVRFTKFRDDLIVALYHKSNEQGLDLYHLKELADEEHIPFREGWIFEFCNFLDEHGYALVRKVMGGDEHQAAQLNASGFEYVEELIAESEQHTPPDTFNFVPGSDRYVEIDHNSQEYKEAVDALDGVIENVRNDNEYGSEAPEEREQIITALQAGRNFLNATKVRISAAIAIILPPLQYLADNFGKGAIAAAAAIAVGAVAKLLGII